MHVYVCVFVCMHVYVCVYMYLYMCVYVCVYMCAFVCVFTYVYIYMCVVLRAWQTFHYRSTWWDNSFSGVAWESKYDVGKPETCKDPKNTTDEAILLTL